MQKAVVLQAKFLKAVVLQPFIDGISKTLRTFVYEDTKEIREAKQSGRSYLQYVTKTHIQNISTTFNKSHFPNESIQGTVDDNSGYN